jgi:CelD/BcsL family acetyltransferase involved in cellulose biosynthesis
VDSLRCGLREEVDDSEWQVLIEQTPGATVFHHPRFARSIVSHARRWRAQWMEVRANESLIGGLPILVHSQWGIEDWVSGWGGSYGGPLMLPGWESAGDELARGFHETRRSRRRRSEIVWAHEELPCGSWEGWRELRTSILDLGGFEEFDEFLMESFPKNRRNECSRSAKRGLRVECDSHGAHLSELWSIYRDQCLRWASEPVPQEVLRELLEECEEAQLFVALSDEEGVVGGHVCVQLGCELFAWLGTTRRMDKVYPSSLLIREEARWVHERGLSRLNLGSSMGIGGVQHYKELLGARETSRWILRSGPWWWPKGSA